MTQSHTGQGTQLHFQVRQLSAAGNHIFVTILYLVLMSGAPGAACMQDSSSRQIILITTVDIGEGRTAQIKLREGDSPQVCRYMHATVYDSTCIHIYMPDDTTWALDSCLSVHPLVSHI